MKKPKMLIQEILDRMPWLMRQRAERQVAKYLMDRPSNLAEVERLYYLALGLNEDEVKRRMTVIHDLKTHPQFYARLGDKKLEIRKNDRNFKKGDTLNLREFVPEGSQFQLPRLGPVIIGPNYTGRVTRAIVTDLLSFQDIPGMNLVPGLDNDYVALSIYFPDFIIIPTQLPSNVLHLALEMVRELQLHASKGSADKIKLTGGQCLDQLRQQVHELEQAMLDQGLDKISAEVVLRKAAGVSNYAMFCAQISGAIVVTPK